MLGAHARDLEDTGSSTQFVVNKLSYNLKTCEKIGVKYLSKFRGDYSIVCSIQIVSMNRYPPNNVDQHLAQGPAVPKKYYSGNNAQDLFTAEISKNNEKFRDITKILNLFIFYGMLAVIHP